MRNSKKDFNSNIIKLVLTFDYLIKMFLKLIFYQLIMFFRDNNLINYFCEEFKII